MIWHLGKLTCFLFPYISNTRAWKNTQEVCCNFLISWNNDRESHSMVPRIVIGNGGM